MLDTVLIVDGDAAQRNTAKHVIIEKLKYNTLVASTGQEAIDLVLGTNSVVSLMLLDMRTPQVDSLHVIRSIKSCRPDFPIIILTEYGDHSNATQAIYAGANDFLTKPIAIERLSLSIASALRIYHLCKSIEKLEKQLVEDGVGVVQSQSSPLTILNPSPMGKDGKVKKLRVLEEDAIRFALNICGGSMSKAARSLGIGRSTLYRKISEFERHQKTSSYIVRDNQTMHPTTNTSVFERSNIG